MELKIGDKIFYCIEEPKKIFYYEHIIKTKLQTRIYEKYYDILKIERLDENGIYQTIFIKGW